MKRLVFGIVAFAILISAAILSIGLWYEEHSGKLTRPWKVEYIMVAGKVVDDEFRLKSFSLQKDGRALLPWHQDYQGGFPIRFSTWKYQRRGWFNGQVIIEDTVQGYFDGIYEIEILDHRRPQLMRLYSDSIEFYLREQYFSLDKPTIETEPFIREGD
jgi:hypothetical protein